MYFPKDKYVWDFWTVIRDHVCYLFHLQAPETPDDPTLRHNQASVGLAVSSDLVHWENHGTVFQKGSPGSWDDLSIWTGTVTKGPDGRFYFLYTGRNAAEQGRIQRIGVAVSEDLLHWKRFCAHPVMTADPRYYETCAAGSDYRWESWRDPFLYFCEEDQLWYAFITARRNQGFSQTRGCIAVAKSQDLIHWIILPPLDTPPVFADMEVPTVWQKDGCYYLTFASKDIWFGGSPEHAALADQTGVFLYTSSSLLGPYTPAETPVLLGSASGCYTNRVVRDIQGIDYLLTWHLFREDPTIFTGGIADPLLLNYATPSNLSCLPAENKIIL